MSYSTSFEIVTLEDNSYHILIQATINQDHKAYLIIDTGASKTVFDTKFITPLATNISEVEDNRSSGINAMINKAHLGYIKHFGIGSFEKQDFPCLMLDLSHINDLYKNYSDKFIAGLLGSDFLVSNNAVIDYPNKSLSFSY